jgi:hypothetical protein
MKTLHTSMSTYNRYIDAFPEKEGMRRTGLARRQPTAARHIAWLKLCHLATAVRRAAE